jgi:hypothetical protein
MKQHNASRERWLKVKVAWSKNTTSVIEKPKKASDIAAGWGNI